MEGLLQTYLLMPCFYWRISLHAKKSTNWSGCECVHGQSLLQTESVCTAKNKFATILHSQVGLAVDDTKAIQDQAQLKRLSLQVCNIYCSFVRAIVFLSKFTSYTAWGKWQLEKKNMTRRLNSSPYLGD